MRLREGTAADAKACAALFTAAVHGLAGQHYDSAQRHAWAPLTPDITFWQQRLAGLQVLLAEDASGLLGFIGYAQDGHIDMLFCAPRVARRAVASALYREAETRLRQRGVERLCTEASLLAQPFFLRQGFTSDAREEVERAGVRLPRYRMSKMLD
ncbi:putative acetyltransferase [Halopseudomonas sabulinigri]|uniref:Putative acetyltransferase n=1 Tax=Halopseudomonas sabulinigri TaxID=472181 RepID=A0A1H1W2U2_9GAMM|nr:GNAT family N-acetyltransferase [Halopseudomonas sabulinigri]SDS91447.1 putative acetyltransferase [Halopseudomonas sabulinigri]